MSVPLLRIDDLRVAFGGVQAVNGVNLTVPGGVVAGLIGPNGAGKSTTINAVTGLHRPSAGSVRLAGVELVGLPPARVLAAGVARTFQQAQLWAGMNVLQNLTVPMLRHGRRAAIRRAHEVAAMVGFLDLLEVRAAALPFGSRRLVEVGRALMTRPRIVLLDEPGAGLTGAEKRQLMTVLARLADGGTSILLVDHDMELVMTICSEITVLDAGRVLTTGTPDEVRRHPDVVAAYLGTAA